VSTVGDHLTLVALPIATYARTRSAVAVGVAAAMEAVTALLFGLPAGALADRLRHRRVLVATDLARAAVLVLLALAVSRHGYPVGSIYVAAFALGVLRVLHDAAAGSVLPLMLEGPLLLKANGRIHASDSIAAAAGPALAGALIASAGPASAFVSDAASFVVSGSAVRRLRDLDGFRDPGAWPGLRAIATEIGEGLRALRADRTVVRATQMAASVNVLAMVVEAQFVPYAAEVLHIGSLGIGAYFAFVGGIAAVTALVVGRYHRTRGDAMIAALVAYSSGILVAGLWPNVVTAGLAFLGAGVGSTVFATHYYSLRQRRFPVHLLGRVSMATRMMVLGVMPVAFVGGGVLANHRGPAALFVVSAAVGLAAALWGTACGLARLRVG
jgi:MFS family permease